MDIQEKHMQKLSTILQTESGLVVSMDKKYLVETRLRPVMTAHQITNWDNLITALSSANKQAITQDIVEAMTTNETLFFRDPSVFQYIEKTIMPEIIEKNDASKKLTIWSCASSTGQEAYSISMMLAELGIEAKGWDWTIHGSDIDSKVILKAEQAIYTQFEVQRGMPAKLLIKYFEQPAIGSWKIKEHITKHVKFFKSNLLDPKPPAPKFDLIFCRNVLFYMSPEDRAKAINKMIPHLRPGGYIILGTSEFLSNIPKVSPVKGVAGIFKLNTE